MQQNQQQGNPTDDTARGLYNLLSEKDRHIDDLQRKLRDVELLLEDLPDIIRTNVERKQIIINMARANRKLKQMRDERKQIIISLVRQGRIDRKFVQQAERTTKTAMQTVEDANENYKNLLVELNTKQQERNDDPDGQNKNINPSPNSEHLEHPEPIHIEVGEYERQLIKFFSYYDVSLCMMEHIPKTDIDEDTRNLFYKYVYLNTIDAVGGCSETIFASSTKNIQAQLIASTIERSMYIYDTHFLDFVKYGLGLTEIRDICRNLSAIDDNIPNSEIKLGVCYTTMTDILAMFPENSVLFSARYNSMSVYELICTMVEYSLTGSYSRIELFEVLCILLIDQYEPVFPENSEAYDNCIKTIDELI